MARTIAQLYHQFVGKKAMLLVCDAPASTRKRGDGKPIFVPENLGIHVAVRIVDARTSYGREHVLVQPLRGAGTTWIEIGRNLSLVDEWPEEIPYDPAADQPGNGKPDPAGGLIP